MRWILGYLSHMNIAGAWEEVKLRAGWVLAWEGLALPDFIFSYR